MEWIEGKNGFNYPKIDYCKQCEYFQGNMCGKHTLLDTGVVCEFESKFGLKKYEEEVEKAKKNIELIPDKYGCLISKIDFCDKCPKFDKDKDKCTISIYQDTCEAELYYGEKEYDRRYMSWCEKRPYKMSSNINHPAHYTDGKIEVIDYILDKGFNFCRGNAIKYISRAGKKDKDKEIEDLQKAVWYLNKEIERLKGGRND